jgi:hypothetical protein
MYPVRLIPYETLLHDSDTVVPEILTWVATPRKQDLFDKAITAMDIDSALRCVQPNLQTQHSTVVVDSPLTQRQEALFDDLYQQSLNGIDGFVDSLLRDINAENSTMEQMIQEQEANGREWKHAQLVEIGKTSAEAWKLIHRTEQKRRHRYDRRAPSPLQIEIVD